MGLDAVAASRCGCDICDVGSELNGFKGAELCGSCLVQDPRCRKHQPGSVPEQPMQQNSTRLVC